MASSSVAMATELNFQGLTRTQISTRLYQGIDWSRMQSSGVFLTEDDTKLMENAQSNLEMILDDSRNTAQLVSLLMRIADSCTFDRTLQIYVFTKFEEIFGLGLARSSTVGDVGVSSLSLSPSGKDSTSRNSGSAYGAKHVPLFLEENHLSNTYDAKVIDGPFLRALSNPDVYLQKAAALSLSFILTNLPNTPSAVSNDIWKMNERGVDTLINWVLEKLRNSLKDIKLLDQFMPVLTMLCASMGTRLLLLKWGCLDAVSSLLKKVGVTTNPQRLYELVFTLWNFSLVSDVARAGGGEGITESSSTTESFRYSNVTSTLVDLIAAAPSRKIVRMAVATMYNLARTENDDILVAIFSTNLLRHLETIVNTSLNLKQASDIEFESDVKNLLDLLHNNLKELSTFDRYASELHSGSLSWGIVHTEKFWKENCRFMEANDWALLKVLITYLTNPSSEVQCIALYDLGEFARFFPNGRIVVKSLGAKDIAVNLISSDDEDVQRQALACASKIMVNSWSMMLS
jgi:V-type H+-transporting ATPase subunit H